MIIQLTSLTEKLDDTSPRYHYIPIIMKNSIATIFIILLIIGCDEDDIKTDDMYIHVDYRFKSEWASEYDTLPSGDPIPIYLFYDTNHHTDDFTYDKDGYLVYGDGERRQYDQMLVNSTGFVIFKNVRKATHTVVADLEDSNLRIHKMASMNMNAKLEGWDFSNHTFTIDTWPYDWWEVYPD